MSQDHSLCLVQALMVCLAKTGDKHNNRSFNSSPTRWPQRRLLHNLLSAWLRKLIHYAFQTAEGKVLPLPIARTQEVCALATSLAFRGSMDVILSACLGIPLHLLRCLCSGHRPYDRRPPLPWTYSSCSMLFMLQDPQ